jgi:hypothetical protein
MQAGIVNLEPFLDCGAQLVAVGRAEADRAFRRSAPITVDQQGDGKMNSAAT